MKFSAREQPDDETVVFRMEVEPGEVVAVQAIFETYEGIAAIRTEDPNSSHLTIMTTPSQEAVCRELLESLCRR